MQNLEIPFHIGTAIATGVGTVVMGALTGVGMIFGQVAIPNPAEAGAWSFYGVLIVGICVLGSALGLVARWVATKFLVELEANRKAREESNRVLERLSENIDRQNEFNESQGREALRRAYSYPFQQPAQATQDASTARQQ